MAKTNKGRVNNQIKRIRLARTDWTQADLAEKIGATRQTVIAIEAQKYAPSLELAFRIALAFGEPFEEVFSYDPPNM